MSIPFLLVFLVSFGLIVATYVVYPLALSLIPRSRRSLDTREVFEPTVSILIAAFNEGRHIEAKLLSTLAAEYPRDKLEVLVGSDGSTDDTVEKLTDLSDPRFRLHVFGENRGKTAVQNDLVARSTGDILVFTDAASFFAPEAIRKLVDNFRDPRVGCVAGCMRYIGTDTNLTTRSQGLYWRYESMLRSLESRIGSLIGVDGPLYAVRRECYVPLEPHMISDLLTPLLVLEQHRKVVLEPEALVDENPTEKVEQEFRTRRRVVLRGLTGIWAYRRLLNPFKHPLLAAQLFLHKLVRWAVGLLAIVNLMAASALSSHWFFVAITASYGVLFTAAALGWILDRRGLTIRVFAVPYYFILVNAAATMAIIDFCRRRRATTWQPTRP